MPQRTLFSRTGRFIFLGIMITLSACSNPNGLSSLNPETGRHIKNWDVDHKAAYQTDPAPCHECHGEDLQGGNSGVSCFSADFAGMSCHDKGPSGHPADWANPDLHGPSAKAAPASSSGAAFCQTCHGTDLAGGNAQKSCQDTAGCHGEGVKAPHSPAPWQGGTRTHTTTDKGNASVCATCHLYGRTPPVYAAVPSAVQTDCFNNTLCHGAIGHASGWAAPDSHGAAAKASQGSMSGLVSCTTCHGPAFTGGDIQQSCLNTAGCHGASVGAPHSPAPWRTGSRTHTTTDTSNASVCARCHLNNRTPPSYATVPADAQPDCFNNTLCHGATGHEAGWADPTSHGAAAKAAPGSSGGFTFCQTCHGSGFTGGSAQQTCLNTAGCHGTSAGAPHSPAPWRGGTKTHTTTDEGNAAVCALCHADGSNSSVQPSTPAPSGTAPGCFNSTLCHGQAGHATGWSDPGQHGASAKAAPASTTMQGFSTCASCHEADYSGGAANTACSSCHGVSAPHPAAWLPGDTHIHTTTDQGNAPVCARCHLNGRTPPSYAAVPDGTNPGCFNNTLCHGNVGAPHAVPFVDAALHGPSAKADLTYCQSCHSDNPAGGAGSNPRFNVPKGSLAAGCETSGCHNAYMAHPTTWRGLTSAETGHMSAGNKATACALCHGATLNGGIGPACTSCHTAGSPLTLTDCTSCHGSPPDGSSSPNVAGGHAQHVALGLYVVCTTCHSGAGTGTTGHYNQTVNVSVLSGYSAKSGTASFNASADTCSKVSCHGGQTTPNWLTGTIDVNTHAGCTSCHASGTTEYNGYHSGRHSTHLNRGYSCTTCHDTALLAVNHFTHLDTSTMEGPASATLDSSLNYNGTSCNPNCHGTRNW